MSYECTLCLQNAVFPVRFVSNEGISKGEDYHLRGACLHLAQELLASNGPDPEILDQTRTSVIKLEQVPVEKSCFNYFDLEHCGHLSHVRDDNVHTLSLKLSHYYSVSAIGEAQKSIDKRVWIELRDEYQRETQLTQDCWLKQLYNCWVNMGTGGRTIFLAFGSLAVWSIQSIWEAAFDPKGKSKDDEKKSPCSSPVNLDQYRVQVTQLV